MKHAATIPGELKLAQATLEQITQASVATWIRLQGIRRVLGAAPAVPAAREGKRPKAKRPQRATKRRRTSGSRSKARART